MKKTLWSLIFAVAVYTAIVFLSDVDRVGEAVAGMNPLWIPLFLSLSLLNYLFRFFKWNYFLRRIGIELPWRESLSVFIAGFSMTLSPGKLGELLKCYLLRDRRQVPLSRTSPVVVAERVTDLVSMLLIAILGLLLVHHRGAMVAVIAGIVFVAALMTLLLWRKAFRGMTGMLCRVPFMRKYRNGLDSFQRNCSSLLCPGSMMVSVPLGVVSWGLEAMVICLVSASMGLSPGISVGLALLAHSAGTIAGAVSMIPGGLGLTEITIGAILTLAVSEPDAAAVTLIMRFATLWFAVGLGVVMLAMVRKRGRKCPGTLTPTSE